MRKVIVIMTFVVMAVCLSHQVSRAWAGYAHEVLSGSELFRLCQSKSDIDYGFCAGYVTAIAQAMLASPVAGYRACNHGAVRSQQWIDTYARWVQQHPDAHTAPADQAVAQSIAQAFPC
jgi:hypothetical protein